MDRRRRTSPCAIVVALAVVTALVGGCGESDGDLLSQRRASELRDSLARVQQLVDSSDCVGAAEAAQELEREADGLPDGVDSKLREALLSGADRLSKLVEESCAEQGSTGTTGPTVPAADSQQQQSDESQGDEPPGQQKKDEEKGNGKGKEKKKDKDPQEPVPSEPDVVPPEEGGAGADEGSGGFAP